MKASAVGALILCASLFSRASCALEKATIVRNLIISTANASTVPFKDHLYTVSKNQTHIHINSTDNNYKPCDIAIDTTRDVFDSHLEVTPTEEEIFIVGIQSRNTTKIDEYTSNTQYKYTILRVDPTACSYQSVFIPEINDDNRGDYYFPRIVGNREGSDLFFPNLKNCAPCRINDVGSRSSKTISQIPRENTVHKDSLSENNYVQYVDQMNVYTYVYDAHDFSNGAQTTKLKLLDNNDFKTLKERNIDFSVNAISKQKKSVDYFGICTKPLDKRVADVIFYTEVRCDRLNANLDTTNTIRVPIGSRVSSISYEFDKSGNSYLSFAVNTNLRLYIHDKDGKLVKAIDMGEIDEKFKQYPDYNPLYFDPYTYWDVSGSLVKDQYCIVTKQSPSYYSTPVHEVRCVDVV